ncbi:MAG: ABC transporter permease [Phycisphaerales bacterium JB043]
MLGQILAIARNTFLESIRQPIFFILLVTGGILQIPNTLLALYSMDYSDSAEVSADHKLLLDMGLATVFVVGLLLTALISTAVLSREIENKTALTVISKPIGRPLFILGKYLGAVGAVLVGVLILLIFFQFSLRHGTLSTARDGIDGPVVVFGMLAMGFSIGLGAWGNYFYGWVFSSTCVATMVPSLLLALLMTWLVSAEWEWQPISEDFKPQIMLACACVAMSMAVLTSVAVAASTRLGQVMTLVACAGVFMLGLLSNSFFGAPAYTNTKQATIFSTTLIDDSDGDFSDAGDTYDLLLDGPMLERVRAGDNLHYGPSPNGIGFVTGEQLPYEGDPLDEQDIYRDTQSSIVVTEYRDNPPGLVIRNAGSHPVGRAPMEGDSLFLEPTRVNRASALAWGVVPNMQFFWLVDAITQAHTIPPRYIGLVGLYAIAQIIAMLALATMLFQSRDVG